MTVAIFGNPMRPATFGEPAKDPSEMSRQEAQQELKALTAHHERIQALLAPAVEEHKRRAAAAADMAEQHRQAIMSGPVTTFAGQSSRVWSEDSEYRAERLERDKTDASAAAELQRVHVDTIRQALGAIAARQVALSERLERPF